MDMTPQIDQLEPVRRYEQPEARFGANHILRDEIPAVYPEIIDMVERQDEIQFRAAARKGSIAVADTVSVSRSVSTESFHETPTGLYS